MPTFSVQLLTMGRFRDTVICIHK